MNPTTSTESRASARGLSPTMRACRNRLLPGLLVGLCLLAFGCDRDKDAAADPTAASSKTGAKGKTFAATPEAPAPKVAAAPVARKGIGVILVSHGSRSAQWRSMLEDVTTSTSPGLMKLAGVTTVKTAFMEYTEPSIATQA